MLIPRVIPCLLIENGAMVKTRRFSNPTSLGDPLNVINLFNRFEVDEIALLDIGASSSNRGPDFELIRQIAEQCWIPLSYGGGLTKTAQIEQVIRAGVEKVVIGTAVANDLSLISEAAGEFGSQAIVGSIDARRRFLGQHHVRVLNGTKSLQMTPPERAKAFEEAGAGEILLQSIDRDGEMNGYDLPLIASVTSATNLPVIACGGAGRRDHLAQPVIECGSSASAAGSIFVFQGINRAVLINFPERPELENLFKDAV
jgi:cyclase